MSITDLLKQASTEKDGGPLAPVARPAPPTAVRNPVQDLKDRAQDALFGRLGNRLYDASMSEDQLHAMVVQELDAVLMTEKVPLTDEERHRLVTDISDNILGLGPIEPYLSDPSVTEVMANGDDAIYIERAGRIIMTDARFNSTTHLRQVIERIVTRGRAAHRRVVTDGRRPPSRRLPRQRGHPAAGGRRSDADHPEVRPRGPDQPSDLVESRTSLRRSVDRVPRAPASRASSTS